MGFGVGQLNPNMGFGTQHHANMGAAAGQSSLVTGFGAAQTSSTNMGFSSANVGMVPPSAFQATVPAALPPGWAMATGT